MAVAQAGSCTPNLSAPPPIWELQCDVRVAYKNKQKNQTNHPNLYKSKEANKEMKKGVKIWDHLGSQKLEGIQDNIQWFYKCRR